MNLTGNASVTAWEKIAETSDLGEKDRLSVLIDDTPALLIRYESAYYAIEDVCTHDGQPLTDGEIREGAITCPRHGARFDVKTGAALCMPATEAIRVFEVDVRDDGIYARAGEAVSNAPAAAEGTHRAPADQAGSSTTKPLQASPASSNPFLEAPSEGAMLDALKQVLDPEMFVNIVDLGLVYDISKQENDVVVTMTLTSPACPAGPQIVSEARSALEKMPGVHHAEIKLTMSPPWTPDMMTEDARDQLGIF
ncbi:MAG: DUF59 domain-containing protein [Planctomycetaceae bacterium]|nr:DUF59 domain-containing protein [Planctomycetaceae bacterium]